MWSKLLFTLIALLLLLKVFFKSRWAALKARLDFTVNVLLVLLLLSYAVQLLVRF